MEAEAVGELAAFTSLVTARFHVLFKLLNVKKTINCNDIHILPGMVAKYFSCTFLLFKNATNL